MLKFFRRIRQRLIREGSLKRYLLYAIGEILLVVIGILLALQINNLNEQSKTRNREQKYLRAMSIELKNNLASLQKEKERLSRNLEAQRKLMALMDADSDTVRETYLSQLVTSSFSAEIFLAYEQGTFTELLSTGRLRDISSDSIKTQIASWDGKMVDVRNQEEELLLYRNTITQFLIDHSNLKTFFSNSSTMDEPGAWQKNHSNKHLLQSQTFENYLILYLIVGEVLYNQFYPELEANINSLLALVEKDIEPNEK